MHPCSLISTFVVRCLDSIIPLVSTSGISSLCQASVAAQAGLSLPLLQTLKTGFLVMRLQWYERNITVMKPSARTDKSRTNVWVAIVSSIKLLRKFQQNGTISPPRSAQGRSSSWQNVKSVIRLQSRSHKMKLQSGPINREDLSWNNF